MILTTAQQKLIRARADDTQSWRDEEDLVRRRRISDEVRLTIQSSKILEGATLDHKTFCKLISLQWQVQNLNPMQMPRLIGTYHYPNRPTVDRRTRRWFSAKFSARVSAGDRRRSVAMHLPPLSFRAAR